MGLGLAIHDFELDAELLAHPLDEFGPVHCGAAGFGGDGARSRHTARGHLVPTDAQGLERAGDRLLAEAPGEGKAIAETDNAGKGVDDAETLRRRPGDQEPAIVGAKIQSSVGRSAISVPSMRPPERRVEPLGGTQRGCFRQQQKPQLGPPEKLALGLYSPRL